MEQYKIKNLSFTYHGSKKRAVDNVSFSIEKGEFFLLYGASGSGKSTLLRLMKHLIAPSGEKHGEILYCGKDIALVSERTLAGEIGFVFQDPDNQIVCEKVSREMCFGPESLGLKSDEIQLKVAENASFFGIDKYFNKSCSQLSGGQKQLLNLAGVMTGEPDVLLLDEPLSQLDPVARADFISYLTRLNKDYGVTIVLCEHSLDEIYFLADTVCIMNDGKIKTMGNKEETAAFLMESKDDALLALPIAARFSAMCKGDIVYTVKEARNILKNGADNPVFKPTEKASHSKDEAVRCKNITFGYSAADGFILNNLNMSANFGETTCIFGGNGAGKTTILKVLAGILKPQHGKAGLKNNAAYLPQNPYTAFIKDTVLEDFNYLLSRKSIPCRKLYDTIKEYTFFSGIEELFSLNPMDLSGGEAQKCALLKTMLCGYNIFLWDEPTKGLDAKSKKEFAAMLRELTANGKSVICSSHDIEFFACNACKCIMIFQGKVIACAEPVEFFCANSIYTTQIRKITKGYYENAVRLDNFEEIMP